MYKNHLRKLLMNHLIRYIYRLTR